MFHSRTLKATSRRADVRFLTLLAGLVLAMSSAVPAAESPGSLEALYRRCQAACVEVLVDGRHAGSGWYATGDGLVVTASHLFADGTRPQVELLDALDSLTPATLVAMDRGHDLAVLQTGNRRDPERCLSLARARPKVGEELHQFGAPLFRSGILQSGRIASERTAFEYYGDLHDYVEIVHVSGMMQGGTSGGPWLNGDGEVVGLQSGVMSLEGRPLGIAYLVPAEFVGSLLETRRSARTPTLGLGVDELWQQSGDVLRNLPPGTGGLVVAVIQADGPAAKAGLRTRDVITSVDGGKVLRIREFLGRIRSHQPGETVTLGVLTPGQSGITERRVTLGEVEREIPPAPAGDRRAP